MTGKQFVLMAALAAVLAACGPSGGSRPGPATSADNDACRLLGDAAALFGANADVHGYRGLDDMAATCEFASADGERGGEVILYTVQSLGATSAEARMADVTQRWDSQTETPLGEVQGLGEAAQIATDLPGYQTQIAFRKGGALVLIAGRDGSNERAAGEALARRMAQAAAANVQ